MCEYLTAVTEGQIRRLIINIAPRHGKSTLVSVLWPTWEWARDRATSRWMFASHAEDIAVRDSVRRRNVMLSEWYHEHWGKDVVLSRDLNLKDEFMSTNTGGMFSTWIGGGTGRGGKRLVIDDPHSPKKALSEAELATAVKYIRNVLISRLDNPTTDSVVIVGQRVSQKDICGEFLDAGGWEHLNLPEQAQERTTVAMPKSHNDWTREKGDVLEPERFPAEVLEQIKRELGSAGFSAQYGQQPAPEGGNIFQSEWWQYWEHVPMVDLLVLSVDCAFKGKQTSDLVAMHVYAFVGTKTLLIDRVAEHLTYVATKAAIRAFLKAYPGISHLLIEEAANGYAVIEELSNEFAGVIPVRPQGGKISRAQAASADVEAGNIYLPAAAPWLIQLMQIFRDFPNVRHDDDVDAFSQAVNWRRASHVSDYSMFTTPINPRIGMGV